MQHPRAPSHPVYDWLRRRPYLADSAIVTLLVLLALPGSGLPRSLPTTTGLIGLALAAPLFWRRRHPAVCFTFVSLACFVQVLLLDRFVPTDVGFLLALYAVSAYARQLWVRLGALVVGALGAVLALVDWSRSDTFADLSSVLLPFAVLGGSAALAWTLGDLLRTRRAYIAQLEDRAGRLERERDQQDRLARAAERARIAREMHDVVAHSLSVVVAQADGGLYAGDEDPDAARDALATIGATGRQALGEMRRLLGVLRTDLPAESEAASAAQPDAVEPADLAPQPGLAAVPDLVAQVRASGVPVEFVVSGDQRALPDGIELAAYRIVQEALTNTMKHGGPGTLACVRIDFGTDVLRLRVFDDGRGHPSGISTTRDHASGDAGGLDDRGQGINGMRERTALYGGVLRAGPRLRGGFEVVAELPLDGPPGTAQPGPRSGAQPVRARSEPQERGTGPQLLSPEELAPTWQRDDTVTGGRR